MFMPLLVLKKCYGTWQVAIKQKQSITLFLIKGIIGMIFTNQ